CCLLLSETAALSLPWTGIEPGLPSLPVLRSEPRSGNDRVRDQGGFCNIVGGVVSPVLANRALVTIRKRKGPPIPFVQCAAGNGPAFPGVGRICTFVVAEMRASGCSVLLS